MVDRQTRRVSRKELPGGLTGMVLGSILNQKQGLAGLAQDLAQEGLVALAGELVGAGLIEEATRKILDQAKDLVAFTLTTGFDGRLDSLPGPGIGERSPLRETGFVASTASTDAQTAAVPPAGPYLIKGATLPDSVLPGVKDIVAYIDAGNSFPALEFLSPIKGPALEQLCVAVATGQMTAAEAAAAYDEDVKKQAEQLGIPGW
ncbi:MAG TPA: hypothetical protein VI753_13800 [Anaerolineales bacterium]|nr:hypothetical protein [Anaerolineales bacterium]